MSQTLLQRLRLAAHLTRDDLAEKTGVKERTIRALESGGVVTPRDATLIPIAKALDVDPNELLADFTGETRIRETA